MSLSNLLMRWLHLGAAAVVVGGLLTIRLAVLPALQQGDSGDLPEPLRRNFKRLAHGALGLLLITGFYNYLVVAIPRLRRIQVEGLPEAARLQIYHPLMGLKLALAFTLFALTLLLLKPVPRLEAKRRLWFGISAALGLLIFLLAAGLRSLW